MSIKDDYQLKLAEISAIPDDEIKIPNNIPVGIYIQEADNLYHWCLADKDELVNAGLSWDLVSDLPRRAGALREAEALWNTLRFTGKDASKIWREKSPAAYDLKNKLLQAFRFAFRKENKLLDAVKAITKGNSHADMIQDLNDLKHLGEQKTDLLAAINFDMSLLDKAAETSVQMAKLLAAATDERDTHDETKRVRNKAFTYLKKAVDEIYEYGQFIFKQNDKRRWGYKSYYMYTRRKKNLRKAVSDGNIPSNSTAPGPRSEGVPDPYEEGQEAERGV
jgi:hypothetical protein